MEKGDFFYFAASFLDLASIYADWIGFVLI